MKQTQAQRLEHLSLTVAKNLASRLGAGVLKRASN
jgi:hypothetical protein